MPLPERKLLPHTPPDFVRSGAVFFLTICGSPRGLNRFAMPDRWPLICKAIEHYQASFRWHVRLALAMPDHLHLLASFPQEETMRKTVAGWKRFLAREYGFRWQRDFFDHRLRGHESLDEKASYIRMNPVRAGWGERPEDWPFVWKPATQLAEPR